MRVSTTTPLLLLSAASAAVAAPQLEKRGDPSLLVFDAPAFPSSNGQTANIRAFAYHDPLISKPLEFAFRAALSTLGAPPKTQEETSNLIERLTFFLSIGDANEEAEVNLCGQSVKLGKTPFGGMLDTVVSVPKDCKGGDDFSLFDSGARDSWAMVSDIDDTVKDSQVLAPVGTVLRKTFLEEPKPVAGMSELYSKLGMDTTVYLTGSPWQLYPMLRSFIKDSGLPAGPVLPQNLTAEDPGSIFNFIRGSEGTMDHKLKYLDRLHTFWGPEKKVLVVGDSGQKDPEVYGEAARRWGDWVRCIWIRRIEEGDNSDARYDAALEKLDRKKFRLFKDPKDLEGIDVKGGQC